MIWDDNFKVKLKLSGIFIRGPIRSKITTIIENTLTTLTLQYSRVNWHQVRVFSPSTLAFPCLFHSTAVPRSFIRLSQPLCNLTSWQLR